MTTAGSFRPCFPPKGGAAPAAPRSGPDTIERSRGMDRIFTAVANRIAAFVGQPLAFAGARSAAARWQDSFSCQPRRTSRYLGRRTWAASPGSATASFACGLPYAMAACAVTKAANAVTSGAARGSPRPSR